LIGISVQPGFGVEVETIVFLEAICSEAASFSEPQLPPEIVSLKRALLV
jgi:hypothetical protein